MTRNLRRAPSPTQSGFTLVEVLIAMMVMVIAVVALVGALTSMITAAQNQKGLALVEATAKNYSQVLNAQMAFATKSSALLPAGATRLQVQDDSLLPSSYPYLLGVEAETVRVTGKDASGLIIVRGIGDPASAVAHPAGSDVIRIQRCGSAAEHSLAESEYAHPAGVKVQVDPSVSFWVVDSFRDRDACLADYDARCRYTTPSGSAPDVRAACGSSVARLTLNVTTADDPRLQGTQTSTQVLIRRGSPL